MRHGGHRSRSGRRPTRRTRRSWYAEYRRWRGLGKRCRVTSQAPVARRRNRGCTSGNARVGPPARSGFLMLGGCVEDEPAGDLSELTQPRHVRAGHRSRHSAYRQCRDQHDGGSSSTESGAPGARVPAGHFDGAAHIGVVHLCSPTGEQNGELNVDAAQRVFGLLRAGTDAVEQFVIALDPVDRSRGHSASPVVGTIVRNRANARC